MQARDAVHDGESEASAGGIGARGFQAGEGAFQAVDFTFRNARAAVADLDVDFAGGGEQPQADLARAIFGGIVEQVGDGARDRLRAQQQSSSGAMSLTSGRPMLACRLAMLARSPERSVRTGVSPDSARA